MKIRLLTITHKVPNWIEAGYQEYIKRLPPAYSLELIEVPAEKQTEGNQERILQREGEKLLSLVKPTHHIIALDVKGSLWSTEQLADQLAAWQQARHPIDLLVGGPFGLSPDCLKRASQTWSLSPLTFPHFIVRLIVAEQFYRAFSILQKHPYHR